MKKESIAEQVVFITGGGRGIGRRMAEQFAAAGAKVAIAARTKAQLDDVVAVINDAGGQCTAFALDVTDIEVVKQVVDTVHEQLGPIDLLINNAGIGAVGAPVWETDPAAWWRVMEVNVRGLFNCTQVVLQQMMARNQGRIINVGSYAGTNSTPMGSAYGASKAALLHLTDTVAAEIGEAAVAIFAISPGLVYTDMTKDVPIFKDLPDSAWTSIDRAGEVCLLLASGVADELSGRFMHVSDDDLSHLVERSEEIVTEDLQVLRLRRLSAED